MLMANRTIGNPSAGKVCLVKYVVPEEGVDHMTHGDGESGDCDIEGEHPQTPVPFMIGAILRRQVRQLKGLEGADYIAGDDHVRLAREDALGQEVVDIGVRV